MRAKPRLLEERAAGAQTSSQSTRLGAETEAAGIYTQARRGPDARARPARREAEAVLARIAPAFAPLRSSAAVRKLDSAGVPAGDALLAAAWEALRERDQVNASVRAFAEEVERTHREASSLVEAGGLAGSVQRALNLGAPDQLRLPSNPTWKCHQVLLSLEAASGRLLALLPPDAAMVAAVISMGHSLGLRVVAEGVESSEQASFLRDHGCDELQGFLFGRPIAPEALAAGWIPGIGSPDLGPADAPSRLA